MSQREAATEASRGRIADIERKTKRYPSDLTDEEWERIAPLTLQKGKSARAYASIGLSSVF
jgi:hypothetical protein